MAQRPRDRQVAAVTTASLGTRARSRATGLMLRLPLARRSTAANYWDCWVRCIRSLERTSLKWRLWFLLSWFNWATVVQDSIESRMVHCDCSADLRIRLKYSQFSPVEDLLGILVLDKHWNRCYAMQDCISLCSPCCSIFPNLFDLYD